MFLYELSSCITEALTPCLPCSHHLGYWASSKPAKNTSALPPQPRAPAFTSVGLEILGYPQQSAAPPGVDILAEKEVELKWGNDEYRRTTLEGMDRDGMDVLSSCVAAQT